MTKRGCLTCMAWECLYDNAGLGECRRHAPKPTSLMPDELSSLEGSQMYAMWPVTAAEDWCLNWLSGVGNGNE